MREIKLRGKRNDNGEWVEGSFVFCSKKHAYIVGYFERGRYDESQDIWINGECVAHKVKIETVGQYTGLKDKNGKEIYEGDIVRDIDTDKVFEIMYQGHMFLRYERKPMYMFYTLDGDCLEVIGNIYDNPELLGEGHED